jgi:hypothetical protein
MGSARHIELAASRPLALFPRGCLKVAILFLSACSPVCAQSVQALPEIDVNVTINDFMRTYLQAKDDRDGGASNQFTIGPSMQFYLKPILTLKRVTEFDLDDSKSRPLVLEGGYRYITAPNEASTNRFEPVLTSHFPLKAGFLISDRNRADLDWKSGSFTWRYRNKLTVERTFAAHTYHFIPYVAAEPYYVEQYKKWSTTDLYAGALFPVGKHVQFNIYYEHENNTGKSPNQSDNYIGLMLDLYYSRKSK